jgi:hypothetical protein
MDDRILDNIDDNDFGAANKIRFTPKQRFRKNSDLVAAMYAMYKMGPDGHPCSLEKVAKVYGRKRSNISHLFKIRGYKLRPRVPDQSTCIVYDGKTFCFSSRDRRWRMTGGSRKYLHRYIWEKEVGPIPPGHGVYHKDLDRTNNALENLGCAPEKEIQKILVSLNSSKWSAVSVNKPKNDEKRVQENLRQTKRPDRPLYRGSLLLRVQPNPGDRNPRPLNRPDTRGGNIGPPSHTSHAPGPRGTGAPRSHDMPGLQRQDQRKFR